MNGTVNYKDKIGKWVSVDRRSGKALFTQSGSVWYDMRTRCLVGGSIQSRQSRYIGCTISDNFCDFQKFTDWHIKQSGFGLFGYELDKDLLIIGNKLYSEETCVLLPKELNMFLISEKIDQGLWPAGVYLDKRRNNFVARLSILGKQVYLGAYATPEQASAAYVDAKNNEARRWVARLKTNEFIVDERVINRLENWSVKV